MLSRINKKITKIIYVKNNVEQNKKNKLFLNNLCKKTILYQHKNNL